ncbi:MAG: hypothetical protein Q8M15_05845 [Bacteroidota bacterium]|nr:hypothetical protein [Bacteroidota bacterium]
MLQLKHLLLFIPLLLVNNNKAYSMDCKQSEIISIANSVYNKLNRELDVDSYFFDSLIVKYGKIELLLGLKAYYLYYNNDTLEAKKIINEIQNESNICNYGFLQLINSLFIEERTAKLAMLNESYKSDSFQINRYCRLELYYYYKNENKSLAKKNLIEALSIDKYFPEANLEMAYLLKEEGNKASAYNLLTNLSKEKYVYALNLLGEFYLEDKIYEKAKKVFTESQSISKNIEATIGLGYIKQYYNHKINEALELYFSAYLLKGNTKFLIDKRIGLLYLDINEIDSSIKYLIKAKDGLQVKENYNDLTHALIIANHLEDADTCNNESIKLFGIQTETSFFSILINQFMGKKEKAKQELDDFYKKYPNSIDRNWLKKELKRWNIIVK